MCNSLFIRATSNAKSETSVARILRSSFLRESDMAMHPEPVPTSRIVEFLFSDNPNSHSTINSVSGRGISTLEST